MSYTKTTNGATSLKTTGSNIVDYFMMFSRDLDKKVNYEYLEKCWNDDPKKTVAIIFNGRDRVNGKKEKNVKGPPLIFFSQGPIRKLKEKITCALSAIPMWIVFR